MNAPNLLPAGSILLGLAAFAASLLTRRRARKLAAAAEQHVRVRWEEFQAIAGALQKTSIDGHGVQLTVLEHHSEMSVIPAPPRAGMNLAKRSQVVRLHRKGDPPDRIAAALDIPLQEVDLLIKVHRIVLGSL